MAALGFTTLLSLVKDGEEEEEEEVGVWVEERTHVLGVGI